MDVLIDALEANLQHARLLVVGDGPARASLERMVAGHSAGLEAHFAGAVSDAEIPHYLAALDVLVLPSRTTPRCTVKSGNGFSVAVTSTRAPPVEMIPVSPACPPLSP